MQMVFLPVSLSVSWSTIQLFSHQVCLSVSQSDCAPVSPHTVSQLVCQLVNQSGSQSVFSHQSTNHWTVTQLVSQSASIPDWLSKPDGKDWHHKPASHFIIIFIAQVQFYVKGHSVSLFLQFPQQSMQWVFLMLRNRLTTLNSRKYTYCTCRSWLFLRLIVRTKKSIRCFCSQDRCFFCHATCYLPLRVRYVICRVTKPNNGYEKDFFIGDYSSYFS